MIKLLINNSIKSLLPYLGFYGFQKLQIFKLTFCKIFKAKRQLKKTLDVEL
tara:strand:+ start:57896 stop:58048 length:153 start_codon:yes stop_codon:yes gene_type:complete